MVDGDGNDSFDTSVVRDAYEEDFSNEDFVPSSPPASQATNPMSSFDPNGPVSSFDASIASQDSVTNYLSTVDHEKLLKRTGAFRPSVPPAARRQPSSPIREPSFRDHNQTPGPQLRYPIIEMGNSWGEEMNASRTSSTKTIRAAPNTVQAAEMRHRIRSGESEYSAGLQKRSHTSTPRLIKAELPDGRPRWNRTSNSTESPKAMDRLATSISHGILDMLGWAFKVLVGALNILVPILAFMLAIVFFTFIVRAFWSYYEPIVKNVFSPICAIPGMVYTGVPFCSSSVSWGFMSNSSNDQSDSAKSARDRLQEPIEFDDLINIQSNLESVLEESSTSVSLPLEMKKSEQSIRDLRTLVRASHLEARDSLILEFDGFIESTSKSADGLTQFVVDVGTAVDRVVAMNKHTMRYISSLVDSDVQFEDTNKPRASSRRTDGLMATFIDFLLEKVLGLQPQRRLFTEGKLRQKYIEHASVVAGRIEDLLVEAQAVLRDLNSANGYLDVILEIVTREQGDLLEAHDEEVVKNKPTLWSLWGFLSGSGSYSKLGTGRQRALRAQIDLLSRVNMQRGDAVDKLTRLVHDLKEMKIRLADLRDRVEAPGVVYYAAGVGRGDESGLDAKKDRSMESKSRIAEIPLSVHIETINRGLERLEEARKRLRKEEDERVQEVLRRGRDEEAPLLEDGK